MNDNKKPRRIERVNIERAIYQNTVSKDYTVISYSKETKKTKQLGKFDNLQDARIFRDNNLRFAKYGKGIQKNGRKFRANVMLYAGNRIENFYIGSYNTAEEAKQARIDFIEKLK